MRKNLNPATVAALYERRFFLQSMKYRRYAKRKRDSAQPQEIDRRYNAVITLSIPLVRAHPAEFAPVQAVRLGLRFQADELAMPQVLIFADHF